MIEKIKYGYIDLFKFIASLLVITIHTEPLITYSTEGNFILTRVLARVAVPFFFISAGYLFSFKLTDNKIENNKLLFSYLKRIFSIYLISIIIYIPINIYNGYVTSNFNLINMLKDLIFNGTMYHLWYLPALILGICIVFMLINNFSINISLIITIILYILGLLGDSYFKITSNIDLLNNLYNNMFLVFDYTRNGIFFAPVFILLGFKFAKLYNKQNDKDNKYSTKNKGCLKDLRLFLLFVILLGVEATLLKKFNIPKHDSMTIFLVPAVYFLFKLCIKLKNKSMKKLRDISLYIYILHPMIIVLVRLIGKVTKTTDILINNSLINYISVTLISILVSVVLVNINNILKFKNNN